jgi:hypothetical protein
MQLRTARQDAQLTVEAVAARREAGAVASCRTGEGQGDLGRLGVVEVGGWQTRERPGGEPRMWPGPAPTGQQLARR